MLSHKELLEGTLVSHDELSQVPPPWWKKYVIGIIAFFLLILLLVYFLSGNVIDTIESKFITQGEQDGLLSFNGITIQLSPDVLMQLRQEYLTKQEREIKACLIGTYEEHTSPVLYNIHKITFPEIISATVAHISTEYCPNGTLIHLHSHPTNRCIASDTDKQTHARLKQSNEHLLMIVMCNVNSFSIYQ